MEYFYAPPERISASRVIIEGEEFAHLTHVMRRGVGDTFRVVDGHGHAYDAVIREIDRRTARCDIVGRYDRLHEPAIEVTVAAAVLKGGSHYEYLVEKVTELGVVGIVPLLTERTIPRHARTDRWQKIALAAMKQSGRCVLPNVWPLVSFGEFIGKPAEATLRLIPHEKVERPALQESLRPGVGRVCLCIGPEGGFTDEEVRVAEAAGFVAVTLGPRRLRAETAAVIAAALVLHHP